MSDIEKIWRVEWVKRTVYRIKSFRDEGAARRHFQKYANAQLTEIDYSKDGSSKVISVTVAGTGI